MHNKKAVIISQSHIFIENKLLALNLEKLVNYIMDSAKSCRFSVPNLKIFTFNNNVDF